MAFDLEFKSFPEPDGPLRFALVPWDSAIYRFPFYELQAAELAPAPLAQYLPHWLAQLPHDRACLVYTKIAPGAVSLAQALAKNGFYPVETLLDLVLPLSKLSTIISKKPAHLHLRPAKLTDQPRVRSIAAGAFAADRFHLDPNLSTDKSNQRFAYWIDRSFADQDPIFILEDSHQEKVIGFVQCRETATGAMDVTLGAVDKEVQLTGIGILMYQLLFNEIKARGYRDALTRTSLYNMGVFKLCMRLGFLIRSALNTLHWFRPAPTV